MGGEPRRTRRGERAAAAPGAAAESRSGRGSTRPQQRLQRRGPADPIFSKPYEPAPLPQPERPRSREPQQPARQAQAPQVAALLGGLKRA